MVLVQAKREGMSILFPSRGTMSPSSCATRPKRGSMGDAGGMPADARHEKRSLQLLPPFCFSHTARRFLFHSTVETVKQRMTDSRDRRESLVCCFGHCSSGLNRLSVARLEHRNNGEGGSYDQRTGRGQPPCRPTRETMFRWHGTPVISRKNLSKRDCKRTFLFQNKSPTPSRRFIENFTFGTCCAGVLGCVDSENAADLDASCLTEAADVDHVLSAPLLKEVCQDDRHERHRMVDALVADDAQRGDVVASSSQSKAENSD